MNQNRVMALLVIGAALGLLSGCISGTQPPAQYDQRIYFSHSIDKPRHSDLVDKRKAVADDASTVTEVSTPELVLYFDNDSATVRREDIERLQSFLLNFPAQTMPVFLITGHTDSNHSDLYNIGLSDRRARSTQAEMLKMGVPITQTALRGLGESTPIASNTNDEGRQSNRRVTVKAIN